MNAEMVVDSSAIIAIVKGEPEAEHFARLITVAPAPWISTATLFEAAIVVDGMKSPRASAKFSAIVEGFGLRMAPVTEQHYRLAREAYRRFGRGNHRAGLNFGDCFAYALAMASGEPLLFKGNDFALTDVRAAV